MKKNKLIIFDWGEIVESHYENFGTSQAFNELFKVLGYKNEDIDIFKSLHKYKLSSISSMEELEETYNEIKKEFDLEKDFAAFVDNYIKIMDKIYYYKDVVEFEHSLKDKCYIGILSNLVILDEKRINKQLNLSMYDYVFLSYKFGLKKPNKDIYEEVMKNIEFKPEEILFIDDSEKNIETAKSMGWNTLIATGKELNKIKEKCYEFLK